VEKELGAAFSDISVELIPGHGGVFEVRLDDKLIYTKSDTGRFPDAGEIIGIIKNSV
jgi:selenoprotein W-related protein